jgi:serine/threonine protein kinase
VTEKRQCPKCGTELSPGAAQGLCPKCLLDAGLDSQAASAAAEAATGPFVAPSQAAAATIPKPERFAAPGLETLAGQFPQLDNFEHLGRGGMGVVYKARQRNLNRPVAVKILPPSSGDDPAFAERFTREAQALARLNHPNIVQVHDFGRTEDHFYFIMEYVDGVNLRALIHDGNLKPEEALKIVPQICEALQFAHDEGIVHRDIKPENILIDKKGRVKIADFGLAKLLGHAADDLSLTGTGQLMGTLGYMAPEQLQQAHSVDHRADIYSLGVVFYEMLTGQLPIGRFQPPSKKVHVDVRLDEIVLRSLESEPDRRYQHVSEVKTDLDSMNGSATQPRGFEPDDKSPEKDSERRELLRSRLAARIAEHPILCTVAILSSLPTIVLLVLFIHLLVFKDASPGTPTSLALGPIILLIICGTVALVSWACLWRASHPARERDRPRREPVRSRLAARIDEHPILWTLAIIANLPAILAAAVLSCSLIVGVLSPGSAKATLAASALGLVIFGPLALAAWASLWWATHFLVKDRRAQRNAVVDNVAVARAVDEVAVQSLVHRGSMAPPTEPSRDREAQRQEELAHRAPASIDLTALALFLGGWIFMGMMWNLRYAGMALAIAVMAGLVYCILRWKLKYLPELRAELSRQSRFQRGVALASFLAVFFVAMSAVVAAQIGFWNAIDALGSRDWLDKLPFAASGAEARSTFPLGQTQQPCRPVDRCQRHGRGRKNQLWHDGVDDLVPLLPGHRTVARRGSRSMRHRHAALSKHMEAFLGTEFVHLDCSLYHLPTRTSRPPDEHDDREIFPERNPCVAHRSTTRKHDRPLGRRKQLHPNGLPFVADLERRFQEGTIEACWHDSIG